MKKKILPAYTNRIFVSGKHINFEFLFLLYAIISLPNLRMTRITKCTCFGGCFHPPSPKEG